jgi:carbon storage regulator CsrA
MAIDPATGKAREVKFQVVVVDIRGDKVRLGFEGAPDFIPIHRDEVWLQIDAEEQRKRGK